MKEENNSKKDGFLTFYEKEWLKDQRKTGEFNIGERMT